MYFRYTKEKVSMFALSFNGVCVCVGVSEREREYYSHLESPFSVIVFQNLVVSQTLTAGIIVFCGWLYFSMFLAKGETQLSQLGLTCSVFTVSMYLSPLSSLVRANTRSEEAVGDFIQIHRMCVVPSAVVTKSIHTVT